MPTKRRSQTNPQLTITQEDVDQLVQDGIAATIRDERERFHRTEGAVELVRWFEKMKNTFEIIATVGREVANARSWTEVKQMMTDEFCPTEKVQRKPPFSQSKLYSVTPLPNFLDIPKVGETNTLSNKVTSNLTPSFRESTFVKNDKVIALRMYRINPLKTYRVDNAMINKPKASVRTTPITASQSHVTFQENVNPNLNGLSSTGAE
nr:hypothetical protein [Tanacetum cinerariifolium]